MYLNPEAGFGQEGSSLLRHLCALQKDLAVQCEESWLLYCALFNCLFVLQVLPTIWLWHVMQLHIAAISFFLEVCPLRFLLDVNHRCSCYWFSRQKRQTICDNLIVTDEKIMLLDFFQYMRWGGCCRFAKCVRGKNHYCFFLIQSTGKHWCCKTPFCSTSRVAGLIRFNKPGQVCYVPSIRNNRR